MNYEPLLRFSNTSQRSNFSSNNSSISAKRWLAKVAALASLTNHEPSASFSESSGTFTANVITNVSHNWDFVLMSNYLNLTLNGNVLEAFPSGDSTSVLHLLQRSSSLTRFHGFAFPVGDFVILIDKYMFFANQVFDWSFNATNSFGMRFYLSNSFDMYTGTLRFTATAGKVLE